MEKSLLLGLDGVDFEFLCAHHSDLPTIDALLSESVYGRLESTIPPVTSAAWTAGLSGMSPARTGITDFDTAAERADTSVVSSTDVAVPRAWDVVGANGGTSVVIGVPVTYPAATIDGAMVSGFLAPDDERRFAPAPLGEMLPADYAFYIGNDMSNKGGRHEYLDAIYASTTAKFELLKTALGGGLTDGEEPTFVCFVLSETDWIQHALRKHPNDPAYDDGEAAVLDYYRHVDELLGSTLDSASDRIIGLMSDHGFGKYPSKEVAVNEWLRRKELFSTVDDGSARIRQFAGRNARRLLRVPGMDRIRALVPDSAEASVHGMTKLDSDDIDKQNTVATFQQKFSNTGYIKIDADAVDDYDVLVDQLVEELRSLTDTDGETPVVREVHRGTDYYSGIGETEIPDIVFVFEPAYIGTELVGTSELIRELALEERPPPAHKMGGFYALTGEPFDTGRHDAHILDVIPTLYTAMGIPLPDRTDGTVVESVFRAGVEPVGQQRYNYEPTFLGTGQDDDEAVQQRLEDLGYM